MIEVASLLVYSAPVALAALGETVNQKGGSLNIGIEGTMLAGCFFGMATSLSTGSPWLGLLAGTAVGIAFTLLQALFVLKLAIDQVVVGTAINLLGLGLTSTLFRSQYGDSGKLLSVPEIPKFAGIDLVILLMLALAPLTAWLISRSRWGLALRATGEYPQAAEAAGYSVLKLRLQAMLIGGALAGLAGAYLSLGIAGSFATNMTAGRGFVAIAMVTFGRWKPMWVFGACLLVGYADSLQYVFQSKGIGVPFQLLLALPYILALLVLVGVGRGSAAPAALGKPFQRSA